MIAIGYDHGGFALAKEILAYLEQKGVAYKKFGPDDGRSVDYPDVAVPACRAIQSGECDLGILVCGTGIGMSLTANKMRGIRAAACSETFSAKYTRLHNNSNVLCLGGRVIGPGTAIDMVELFLNSEFEGGRHKTRVDKVCKLEESWR